MAPPDHEAIAKSDELRDQGNVYFKKKDYAAAYASYTAAISLNNNSAVLYCNRAASLMHLPKPRPQLAVIDADRAIALDPTWSKAHTRRAGALMKLDRFADATDAYTKALTFEKDKTKRRTLESNLAEARKKRDEQEREVKRKEGRAINTALLAPPGSMIADDVQKRGLRRKSSMRSAHGDNNELEVISEIGEIDTGGGGGGGAKDGVDAIDGNGKADLGDEDEVYYPPLGTAMRKVWLAHRLWVVVRPIMEREFEKDENDEIQGRAGTLLVLTSALVEDPRTMLLDHKFDQQRVKNMLEFERKQSKAPNKDLNILQMITELKSQLASAKDEVSGWSTVKSSLGVAIRAFFFEGMVSSMSAHDDKENDAAAVAFSKAIALLEASRVQWKNVPPNTRGLTLQETMLRGIKACFGVHLMDRFIRRYPERDNPRYMLARPSEAQIIRDNVLLGKVEELADWLLASCTKDRRPSSHGKDKGDVVDMYTAHWQYPRAKGHFLKGFVHMQRGMGPTDDGLKQFGRRGPYVGNPGHLGLAALSFARAAAWYPLDEPDRVDSLWYAMLAMLNRGAFYVADLAVLYAIACGSASNVCQYLDNSAAFHPGKELEGGIKDMLDREEPNRVATPILVWERDRKQGVVPREDEWGGMNEWLEFVIGGGEKENGWGIPLVSEVIKEVEAERRSMEDLERVGNAWGFLDDELKKDYEEAVREEELRSSAPPAKSYKAMGKEKATSPCK